MKTILLSLVMVASLVKPSVSHAAEKLNLPVFTPKVLLNSAVDGNKLEAVVNIYEVQYKTLGGFQGYRTTHSDLRSTVASKTLSVENDLEYTLQFPATSAEMKSLNCTFTHFRACEFVASIQFKFSVAGVKKTKNGGFCSVSPGKEFDQDLKVCLAEMKKLETLTEESNLDVLSN